MSDDQLGQEARELLQALDLHVEPHPDVSGEWMCKGPGESAVGGTPFDAAWNALRAIRRKLDAALLPGSTDK